MMLCQKLLQSGLNNLQSNGNFDVIIIKKVMEESVKGNVYTFGGDTDRLMCIQ